MQARGIRALQADQAADHFGLERLQAEVRRRNKEISDTRTRLNQTRQDITSARRTMPALVKAIIVQSAALLIMLLAEYLLVRRNGVSEGISDTISTTISFAFGILIAYLLQYLLQYFPRNDKLDQASLLRQMRIWFDKRRRANFSNSGRGGSKPYGRYGQHTAATDISNRPMRRRPAKPSYKRRPQRTQDKWRSDAIPTDAVRHEEYEYYYRPENIQDTLRNNRELRRLRGRRNVKRGHYVTGRKVPIDPVPSWRAQVQRRKTLDKRLHKVLADIDAISEKNTISPAGEMIFTHDPVHGRIPTFIGGPQDENEVEYVNMAQAANDDGSVPSPPRPRHVAFAAVADDVRSNVTPSPARQTSVRCHATVNNDTPAVPSGSVDNQQSTNETNTDTSRSSNDNSGHTPSPTFLSSIFGTPAKAYRYLFGRRDDEPIPATKEQLDTPTSTIDPDPGDATLLVEVENAALKARELFEVVNGYGTSIDQVQLKPLREAFDTIRDLTHEFEQRVSNHPDKSNIMPIIEQTLRPLVHDFYDEYGHILPLSEKAIKLNDIVALIRSNADNAAEQDDDSSSSSDDTPQVKTTSHYAKELFKNARNVDGTLFDIDRDPRVRRKAFHNWITRLKIICVILPEYKVVFENYPESFSDIDSELDDALYNLIWSRCTERTQRSIESFQSQGGIAALRKLQEICAQATSGDRARVNNRFQTCRRHMRETASDFITRFEVCLADAQRLGKKYDDESELVEVNLRGFVSVLGLDFEAFWSNPPLPRPRPDRFEHICF